MTTTEKLKEKLRRGSRLSCQEVRKLLRELGFELARQKGSHEQWVKAAPHYVLDAMRGLLEEFDG